jgi:hypothetical protein
MVERGFGGSSSAGRRWRAERLLRCGHRRSQEAKPNRKLTPAAREGAGDEEVGLIGGTGQ